MSEELKPCPFCGGTEAFVERLDYSSAYVQCDSSIDEHCACLARGPVGVQDDDDEETPGGAAAIRAWNRRTPAEQPAPASTGRDMLPVGTLAWALIAPNGNIRTWSYSRTNVDRVHAYAPECTVVPVIGARPVQATSVAARELDVEAERREFEAECGEDYENMGGEYAGPGKEGWYYWSDETAAAWDGWLKRAARSAAQGTAQRLVSAEDKLHALHAEADELGAALDRDITLYGSGGAPVSTEQAGDAWVSVEDRLPKPYDEVIVWPHPTDYCMTAEFYGHSASGRPVWKYGEYEDGWGHSNVEITAPVTHWQPKPAAPSPNNSPVGADKEPKCGH